MIANYHVLFVHFPTALLPIYVILELVRSRRILEKPYWFYIKATFSILGMASAHIASFFGETIENGIGLLKPEMKPAIEVHSGMAALTTLIFTILGLAYLVAWVEREYPAIFLRGGLYGKLLNWALHYKKLVLKSWVSVVLALIGLLFITATGALGGAIVHGPNVDPVASFFYYLLVR